MVLGVLLQYIANNCLSGNISGYHKWTWTEYKETAGVDTVATVATSPPLLIQISRSWLALCCELSVWRSMYLATSQKVQILCP